MTQLKYQVPASGLAAAMENAPEDLDPLAVALILQAFVKWQSEHPIVPTEEQMTAVRVSVGFYPGDHRQLMAEWIRRMYLAPEPSPIVQRLKEQLTGCTLTAGDAVELMDAVRMCTSPESQPLPASILEEREIEAHNARCKEFLKDEMARRDQAAGMMGHLGVTRHVCPECARHGHEGIPATRDRHSDYPGDGNCSVCGGYCDQSS